MFPTWKTVLITIAHPDDEVVGMGGTIARLVLEGKKVIVLCSSYGKIFKDSIFPEDFQVMRATEIRESCRRLGCDVELLPFEDTMLDQSLRKLIVAYEAKLVQYQPDVVFTHWDQSLHQDHVAVAKATLIASRKLKNVMFFWDMEAWRSSNSWKPSFFVDISKYLDIKEKAIVAYQSQSQKWSEYVFAENRFRAFGLCDGMESFVPVRLLF